ncbi:V-type proton ATPase subunit E 1 [Clonorchis sinensis]|uniref:V-type H+-transporting ATPase subunit E n=2 Tax=Clonorchis sinensis TaxID=79923 RepID=G7YUE5_CLOSI|nr:V-type proton ATPase subunit E 1 [Clonorchis sinensis]GAA56575.1 V-type H+-transporting ATPase subunit E [Clonorchis sinensis]
MALNETEVQRQIKHMMAFIDQEAREKVEEIDAKAEEEFQIEKSRLVQNQRLKIMEYYARKEKQIELTKKIQDSNLKNQSRLKVLQSRENHIETLLSEARDRLAQLSRDRQRYQSCLTGLITQSLFQLLEPEVIVKCRKVDRDLIQSILPACLQNYEQQTRAKCTVTISNDYLPDTCAGGVELSNKDGRIKVVNTLESRLEQIGEQMMPQLREILFGVNDNRKFRD